MPLEAATYLDDLVTTNPVGASDLRSTADDHLRLIKSVLKATFPGFDGRAARVQSKSATYTVVATDNFTIIHADAAITLDLTAAATLGNGFSFVVYGNGFAATVDPDGAETINGAATLTVPDGSLATVWCNGTAWFATTTAQPLDATLTALAALTIAANTLLHGTGADAFSVVAYAANTFPARASTGDLVAKAITDFGLSLVDDANAAAGRTTLELVAGAAGDIWMEKAGDTATGDQVLADVAPGSTLSAGFRGVPVVTLDADGDLLATYAGKLIRHTDATGRAWTIQPVATIAHPVGTAIVLRNFGTGAVTITRGAGVALRSAGSATDEDKTLTQYGQVTLVQEATNVWVLSGQL